ncbi:hypothetical protein Kisp01_20600 [Kineosporia sp. NBRC 101677]|uniref:J domain-containing protein n=1 Tax=Kineosporia sp. NBRC 101677 TaxID=3032197 RepID=UPI0024A45983|nr:J domain-containing protein [Kineosporia sp. NBRC 101677]GLY15045.1 hypothetical protein Kisp01_20600 [Kineosporia sp. NBRC 101677]
MENYYDVLGVTPSADRGAIRRQYRRLARALHPDRRSGAAAKARAVAAMTRVSQAYETLHDPQRRAQHDQMVQGELPLPSVKEQHSEALLRIAGALGDVMRRESVPGLEQALVNRILEGAAEHLPRAVELVQGRVPVLDGAAQVAAFMALAKSFTSFVDGLGPGQVPEPAYLFLVRATAEECVHSTVWRSRLAWPELPAVEASASPPDLVLDLTPELVVVPEQGPEDAPAWNLQPPRVPGFRAMRGRLRNWLPQLRSRVDVAGAEPEVGVGQV